jgi:hypothetical protein
MKTTLKNMRENNQVSIVAKKDKEYFRISGTVELFSSGKYFDLALPLSKPHILKVAILVSINEIIDLDTQKKIL